MNWVNELCGTKVEVPESWKPKKAKLDLDPDEYEDVKKFALFQSSMSHFQYAEGKLELHDDNSFLQSVCWSSAAKGMMLWCSG